MPEQNYPPRGAVAAASVLVGLLIVGVVVFTVVNRGDGTPAAAAPAKPGPVALVPVDAPDAERAECAALVKAAPQTLLSNGTPLPRAQIAAPAPKATVAWGSATAPVVLRCGLARPPELTRTASLREISGVRWLPVGGGTGENATTWYAVDRPVTVALTVPADAGTGPIQDVSGAISRTLTARPVF